MRVVLLYPSGRVSAIQEQQLTTVGGNVTALEIEGTFDDCQRLVKQAFADPSLRTRLRLTSANSINIGRLLPQSVYYVYSYVRLADVGATAPIIFSVPSGNFGNMMGAILAWRAGVPFSRLIIATNANDEVPKFFATGAMRRSSLHGSASRTR